MADTSSHTNAPTAEAAALPGGPGRKVAMAYTLLRARPIGEAGYRWTGRIHEVSLEGMRFDLLDTDLKPGTRLQVRCMIPGRTHVLFQATGRVVRLASPEQEPGTMGLVFETFSQAMDRERLATFLDPRLEEEEHERQQLRAA